MKYCFGIAGLMVGMFICGLALGTKNVPLGFMGVCLVVFGICAIELEDE